MIYPRPFDRSADILFAQGGRFEITVFTVDGKLVADDSFEVRAGEMREVSLDGHSTGVYVVVVMNGGKAVKSFKILVR